MGIINQNGAMYWATGIDNSGLMQDAQETKSIIGKMSREVKKDVSGMESSIEGVSSALAAIGGTAAIGMLGKQILDTTAKFEKFEIVLKNTLGEAEGAAALDMIAEFAATTPFQLDEVTASFIKMANQGFVPTRSELMKLGDLASSTGKSFDQLTEALLDAQTGQFERLKEFGIKASAQGDKVTFSFKEQQTTVDNTNSAIQAYMLSLGELKGVQGANAKISESLTGQLSNLQDKLASMYNQIGTANKGILYDAVGGVSSLIDNYEEVGKVVLGLVAIYGTYRAAIIITNAIEQASVGIKLANAIAGTTMTASQIAGTAATNLLSIAQAKLNAVILANPYALAAAAVVALAAGIYLLATRTTDAEKAHEKLAKTAKDSEDAMRGEVIQVNTLFARLKAAKSGTDEYKSAKDAIISQYGQYLKGLGDEKTALNNVALAQRTITEEIIKSARARAMTTATADASNDLAKAQGDVTSKIKSLIDAKFGVDSKQSLELIAQIKGVIQNGGTVKESFLKLFDETVYQQQGQFGGTTEYVDNKLKSLLNKAKQAKKLFEEINKEAELKFGAATTQDAVKDNAPDVSETPAQKKTRLAAEKKAKAEAARLKAVQERLSSQEASGEYNAKQDLQGLLLDLQNKTASLLIKNSEDNLQNRLAQIELEKHAEIQKITDKEIAIIDAYNKAHKGDKGFAALSTKPTDIQASISKIDPEAGKQLQTATAGVVSAYGEKAKEETKQWGKEIADLARSFADERVQIEYDYNEKILKLAQAGDIEGAALATSERDKRISEATAAKIQETDLYKTATNDKLQASKETTEKLIADIKKRIEAAVLESDITKRLSREDADKMLKQIDSTQAGKETSTNNPFTNLINGINQYKKAKEALSKESVGTDKYVELEDAANKALTSTAQAAAASLAGVQGILQSVVGGLNQLGVLNDQEQKDAENVIGMVGGAANLAMGIATGNPMAIIQGSIDLLVNGYELFDMRTKNANKEIANQEKAIERLKDSYEDLERAIDKAFSTTKAGLINEEIANIESQNRAISRQIEAEKSKKKPDNSVLGEWRTTIDENRNKIEDLNDSIVEAITGTSVMSAIDSFAQAYADAWATGESAAQKSADVVKGILKNTLINYMKGQLSNDVDNVMTAIKNAMLNDNKIDAAEQNAIDALTSALDTKAAEYESALSPYLDKSKSGVTGELKAEMTEGTGSQLVGLWNMTAMDIRWIREWIAAQSGLGGVSADMSKDINKILDDISAIRTNTGRTADNTDGLVDSLNSLKKEVKEELTQIKNNTKSNKSRL